MSLLPRTSQSPPTMRLTLALALVMALAGCDAADSRLEDPAADALAVDAPGSVVAYEAVEDANADGVENTQARLGSRTQVARKTGVRLERGTVYYLYLPASLMTSGYRYTARVDPSAGDPDIEIRPFRENPSRSNVPATRVVRSSIAPNREVDIVHLAPGELKSGEAYVGFRVSVAGSSGATFDLTLYKEPTSTPPLVLYPLPGAFRSSYVNSPFRDNWPRSSERCTNGQPVPKWHTGLDLRASNPTEVYAVASGVVRGTYDQGKWRWAVVIEHPQLGLVTSYLHTEKRSTLRVGDVVPAGYKLGTVADLPDVNGRVGSHAGDHLHFGVQSGSFSSSNGRLHQVGSLPKSASTASCPSDYPVFPWRFLDPASDVTFE